MSNSAVVVFSGGLDSTTLVYEALSRGVEIKKLVSFNYGQRHKKELEYAYATAERLNLPWVLIDLWSSGLTEALAKSGSSLISSTPVPEGHYAKENMKATVVPNRNMIMLSIAGGIAVAEDANFVLTGVHAGDHAIYPDCRPAFLEEASRALYFGNEGFGKLDEIAIRAPYLRDTKADIALYALKLGVPLEATWSCYKGEQWHCGRCGTCVERLEAIHAAILSLGVENAQAGKDVEPKEFYDRTYYQDTTFWTAEVNI